MLRDLLFSKAVTLYPSAERFQEMMLKAKQNASRCLDKAVQHNKDHWDKTHHNHDIQVGDWVLVSTVKFQNLSGNRKLKDSFVGPFFVKFLHSRNAVEDILTEGYDLKNPIFLVSLLKKYIVAGDHRGVPEPMVPDVDLENTAGLVASRILDENLTRVKGQDCHLFLTRFKGKLADGYQWLHKEQIQNADLLLRKFCAAKRQDRTTHIRAILFWGGKSQLSASQESAKMLHPKSREHMSPCERWELDSETCRTDQQQQMWILRHK